MTGNNGGRYGNGLVEEILLGIGETVDAEKSGHGTRDLSLQSRLSDPCVLGHPVSSWIMNGCLMHMIQKHVFMVSQHCWQLALLNRGRCSWAWRDIYITVGPWCGVGRGLLQWRQPAQREGSFSSWSTHIILPTVTWKHREKKDPSRQVISENVSGGCRWCLGRISVGHLKYVFFPLTFRKSSSEFIRISDLSTVHANPAPGARAGTGKGICGNPAFYPSIRWAEG